MKGSENSHQLICNVGNSEKCVKRALLSLSFKRLKWFENVFLSSLKSTLASNL